MKVSVSNQSWKDVVKQTAIVFPTDMIAVIGLLLFVDVFFLVNDFTEMTIAGARLQLLFGTLFLLFVPGYVLVAILAPAGARGPTRAESSKLEWPRTNRPEPKQAPGIDWSERIALSFGASVALVPIFGVVLGSSWSYSRPIVLAGLEVLLVAGVIIAVFRRFRTPAEERYRVPLVKLRQALSRSDGIFDGAASAFLAVAVLLAVVAIGFAIATPYQSGPSSTLYLTTENETGSLLASGYPSEFTADEGAELVVGIRNDEERRQSFTIAIQVERVRTDGTATTVVESSPIDTLHTDVPAEGEWNKSHTVTPEMVGEQLRIHYYLYRGETAPPNPDASSAYRDVYIWTNVTQS